MSVFRGLGALDRRLPFGAATVVGAAAFAVAVSGGAAAVLKDTAPATVAQAPPAPAPSASASASASAKPKPTAPPKPDSPDDYLPDLERELPGWDRMSDRLAGAGTMTIDDAALLEAGGEKPTEEDRQALRDAGFVRGHSRAWRHENGVTLIVFVYEWKNTRGPTIMLTGMREVNKGDRGAWQPEVPHSFGVCSIEDGRINDTAITAVGKHTFLVVTLSTKGSCSLHEPIEQVTALTERRARTLGA